MEVLFFVCLLALLSTIFTVKGQVNSKVKIIYFFIKANHYLLVGVVNEASPVSLVKASKDSFHITSILSRGLEEDIHILG